MHYNDIKAQIRKQLKTSYPNRKRLSQKEKKAIAKVVWDEVVKDYDFSQQVKTPLACRYQKFYPLPLSRGQPIRSVRKMVQMNRLRNFPPPKTICIGIANECRAHHGDRRSRG